MPKKQGQRPVKYQAAGSRERRLRGCRGEGAFSAQGTRLLKQPRLCLSRRTPSQGLLTGIEGERPEDHITLDIMTRESGHGVGEHRKRQR